MEYDVIVLGATFAAAGIAEALGDRCLILERRPQAGYEFINALNFGSDYDRSLDTEAARALLDSFQQKNALNGDRICLFECAPTLYSLLFGKNVMLNMETVSVEHSDEGFTITAHGVSGYRTYKAKKIVDTTTRPFMAVQKSLNVLVNSDSNKELPCIDGLITEKWGYDGDYVIKCPVGNNDGYQTARKKLFDTVKCLEDFKVAMVADEFDYVLKENIPYRSDGILLLPSQSFSNPLLAFDAGVKLGGAL